jgi:ribosomal protein L31
VQAPQRLVQAAAQKDIHPQLHKAKVICNGEEVLELTGTMPEYHVEVWSGNHPFYKGDTSALVVDEGQVSPMLLKMPIKCPLGEFG